MGTVKYSIYLQPLVGWAVFLFSIYKHDWFYLVVGLCLLLLGEGMPYNPTIKKSKPKKRGGK